MTLVELGTSARRWSDSKGVPWVVRLHWALVQGRAEVVAVEVRAVGNRKVTAETLRAVPFGALVSEHRPKQAKTVQSLLKAEGLTRQQQAAVRRLLAAYEARPPGGRSPLSPQHLERVATVYQAAWQRGENPTQAVAKQLHLARSTAGKHVMRARRAGLLPRTTERVAGGRGGQCAKPTPKKAGRGRRR